MEAQTSSGKHRSRKHGTKGHFGDLLKRGKDGCIRILLQNVCGIGFVSNQRSKETLKMEKLKNLSCNWAVDLMCLTETNKDWRKSKYENTIWGATETWREHRRVQISQNTQQKSTTNRQIGGTATVAFDDLVFRISEQGCDTRKLGRWSYISVTGKNNLTTTFITCYCPVIGRNSGSVYSQHLTYMSQNSKEIPYGITCPRQLFGHDLQQLIETFTNKGNQIMVLGDFNSMYNELQEWMADNGLIDLITEKHKKTTITYNRSSKDPLDVIFGSPSLAGKRSGYLSFHRLAGDHRGLWIDIPAEFILGYNPPQPTHPGARRLKLGDPRVLRKYLTYLHLKCQEANVFERMNELHSTTSTPWPQDKIDEFEKLDVEICGYMDEAELKCRKLKTGSHSWSPTYKRTRWTLEYWKQRKIYDQGLHTNVSKLKTYQRRAGLTYDPSLTIKEVEGKIIEATRKYKDVKKRSEELSQEYRFRLANAKEEAGEIKAAVYLRNFNRIEAQQRLFRNIRYVENVIKGGSTVKVTIKDNNGEDIEITDRSNLEKHILENCERIEHQTENGSQLLQKDFLNDLGKYGEGPKVNDVLNGTYCFPPTTSEATKDFLTNCKKANNATIPPTQPDIVTRYKNYIISWNRRKEKTSSYNQHIGHYKACATENFLSWLMFQRYDIISQTGYTPKRHQRCVDLVIPKRQKTSHLKDLRRISLFDSEFNHFNSEVGREGMKKGMECNALAKEQFCCPGRSSIDQLILKRCTIDHMHFKRQCYSLASCDLSGCYNRIIHTAAALALQRIGVSKKKTDAMFHTLQLMIHRIRTAFGESEGSYGGGDISKWENEMQGLCQGNGSGPTIWTILSSVIFSCLHSRGFSINFCSALSKQLFVIVGFAYVDDCDLFQTGDSPTEVLTSMQNMINSWGSITEVTGGAISAEKCWWYLIDFVWQKGQWITKDGEIDIDLRANDTEGNTVSLKRLCHDQAAEQLGVWICPSGDESKQVKTLKKAMTIFGAKIKQSNLSREEAWNALHVNMTGKVKYCLAASTFTKEQCRSIMWPAINSTLPRSGISRNIACDIRHGPLEFFGLGVASLWNTMGTMRTQHLIEHTYRKTPTGQQINVCIEDFIQEIGLYGSLWSMDFETYKQWTSSHSWIYACCEFNWENNITLSIPHAELSAQREGDRSLMSLASQFYQNKTWLRAINRIRMHLQIYHLSDIMDSSGRCMDRQFLQSKCTVPIRNDHSWPKQHHVTPSDWTKWRYFLQSIFGSETYTLHQRLRSWTMPNNTYETCWDFFKSTTDEYLYEQVNPGKWERHLKHPTRRNEYYLESLPLPSKPSTTLFRSTIIKDKRGIVLRCSSTLPSTNQVEDYQSEQFGTINIQHLPNTFFLSNMSSSATTTNLLNHLRNGTAISVGDGSFFPDVKCGACGWIISTPDLEEWIQGGDVCPGPQEAQAAYRSEIASLIGIGSVCYAMSHHIPSETNIITGCDCQSGLKKLYVEKSWLKPSTKHFDLVSVLVDTWKLSKFSPIATYVKGHQDDMSRHLTILETLNCKMDKLAKSIAINHFENQGGTLSISPTIGFGSITCMNNEIHSCLQKSCYQSIVLDDILTYFSNNIPISKNFLSTSLCMDSIMKARRESPTSVKIFITKWISGDVAVGITMVDRLQRVSSACPFCHEEDESTEHVLRCKHDECFSLRRNLITKLDLWLQSQSTAPHIQSYIINSLQQYLGHANHANLYEDDSLCDQSKIGGEYLLYGFISKQMVRDQHTYFQSCQSRKTGVIWGSKVIKQLWNIVYQLWDHRNKKLHDDNNLYSYNGLQSLRDCITKEHRLGQGSLHEVYRIYFRSPLPTLLRHTLEYQRRWFLLIRSAREAEPSYVPSDDFDTSIALRRWIGLSPR